MKTKNLQILKAATQQLCDRLSELDDFGGRYWLDGFLNVILYGETNHDDDNPLDPDFPPEKAAHLDYKRGATAAMHLLHPPKDSFKAERERYNETMKLCADPLRAFR
jgi:hypothetical protein